MIGCRRGEAGPSQPAGRDQVREETLRALEWFKDRPGFMLASSNSIHNGVPPKNFLAMIEAHRNFYGL